jgi:hypothetical protein
METFLATLVVFAAVMLAMAVGVAFSGRRLKGSCGGTGEDCSCDATGRAECARTKRQASS